MDGWSRGGRAKAVPPMRAGGAEPGIPAPLRGGDCRTIAAMGAPEA